MFHRARRARHTTGVPCSIVSVGPGVGLRHGGRRRDSDRPPWRPTTGSDLGFYCSLLHLQPQLVEGRVVKPSVMPGPVRISTKDSEVGEEVGEAVCAGNG